MYLSVCTIVMEQEPTFQDITESWECKLTPLFDTNLVITRTYNTVISQELFTDFEYKNTFSDYGFQGGKNAINLVREYYQGYCII